jgi:hypothetical protein
VPKIYFLFISLNAERDHARRRARDLDGGTAAAVKACAARPAVSM